ncbi:VOC family protein [Actinoplanes sp. L3-i22]|uniref:VOC family protein n=1 Tax=Actinoplanes sp. L3-i22 TaxID=2836373 RepID=UPI001C74AC40|nr:VOC family protein [Actinoplanes sp. L3-i22]BCY09677.1 glyoxalase [Actinoplanes sp. L3-i22]
MSNIVHFEICVDDLPSAARFYANVFRWTVEQSPADANYWLITTGSETDPGIGGALTGRFDDLNPTINTIEVESVDLSARKIVEEGGKILAPKIKVDGTGHVQYCQDPEGNTFGIVEFDDSANSEMS